MVKFCWVITMLFACGAMLLLLDTLLTGGMSAPQQAAGAALACATAIVPYVFTRAIEGLSARSGSTTSS